MRSVWAISLLVGVYAVLGIEVSGWFLWLRVGLAVLLLCGGLVLWQSRKKASSSAVQFAVQRSGLDYLSAGLLGVIVVTSMSLFVGSVEESEHFARVGATSVFSSKNRVSSDPSPTGESLWDAGMERELSKQSDHTLKNEPELFLEVLGKESVDFLERERIYLRGFSFPLFDGARWKVAERFKKVLSSEGSVELSPSSAERNTLRYRVSVTQDGRGQNLLYTIPTVQRVELERLTEVADEVYLLPRVAEGVVSYTAASHWVDFTWLERHDRNVTAGESIGDVFVQVPPEVWTEGQLAQLLGGVDTEATLVEKLDFVRALLRERCRYSLEVRNVRELGAIQNFLFEEKVGYCEHFASAATLLCRELGIPSRMGYGYSGGVYYPRQNLQVFRARDAHAWTEVLVDGYGWVVFDTTPTDGVQPERASASATLPDLKSAQQGRTESEESRALWGWLVVTFTVSLAFFFWKSSRHANGQVCARSVEKLAYFSAFQRACSQLGIHGVESRSVRDLVGQLHAQGLGCDFLDDLETYHNGVLYQNKQRDRGWEKQSLEEISKWLESSATEQH